MTEPNQEETKEEVYDSANDTRQHIQAVQGLIDDVRRNLAERLMLHDASKLQEPEKSMYDKFTPMLRGLTYGSPEYKQCLEDMGAALQHHYSVNSHHPEHWPEPATLEIGELRLLIRDKELGAPDDPALPWLKAHLLELESQVNGMSLLDVVEMLCDWKAAGQRHADGDITKSLQINRKRFKISGQLQNILENTRKELGW